MSAARFPSWMMGAWPWLAAPVSGVLLALSFEPWNRAWLIWLALAPLLCAVWFPPGKPRPFLLGWLAGVVFYTTTFSWLGSLAPLFKTPLLLGLPLLLGSYLAVYVGFWAWAIQALKPSSEITARSSLRHLAIGALAACAWVALEWVRGWFLSGFGWNGLGVALHANLPMIQIADVTGVLGLSWMVAFCNVMMVVIVRRILAELGPGFLKRIRWEFSATMLVVALVFGYGARIIAEPPAGATTPLRVACIQPNVPQDVKFDEQSEAKILRKLETLTSLAGQLKPHAILWPEAPAVRGMYADEENYKFMMKLAAEGSYDLLVGSLDYEPDPRNTEEMNVYNAAYLLREHGADRHAYRKVHLVPFGEYLPLRRILPAAIGELVPSDLAAGREPAVFTLTEPAIRVSPLICFEDSLGDLTRRSCLGGAQLLVNLTNDSWFQRTVGMKQHLANAVFRAVETRRPLVRCANTGLTGHVDVRGRWEQWMEPWQQGYVTRVVAVPLNAPTTFYMRFGDWMGFACSGVLVVWLIARVIVCRRRIAVKK